MNLDDELRDTMVDHAGDAPHGTSLLDDVRTRVRRADRRRRALTVAAVLVAVVAVAVGMPYALRRGSLPPSDGPTPTGNLVKPEYEPPTFPLTPSWVPDGLGTPRVGRVLENAVLEYGIGDPVLLVSVGPDEPPDLMPEVPSRDTPIGSATGKLRTLAGDGRSTAVLVWRLPDGRWANVNGVSLSESDVERFARGLSATPLPPSPATITMDLAPPGYVLTTSLTDQLCFAPSLDIGRTANLCATRSDMSLGAGQAVAVGDHPGEIVWNELDREVRVSLRPGLTVVVSAPASLNISLDDHIRIAAGITVHD